MNRLETVSLKIIFHHHGYEYDYGMENDRKTNLIIEIIDSEYAICFAGPD